MDYERRLPRALAAARAAATARTLSYAGAKPASMAVRAECRIKTARWVRRFARFRALGMIVTAVDGRPSAYSPETEV